MASSTRSILGIWRDEIVRHFAAFGFVGVEEVVAKRGAGEVEGADEGVRLFVFDQVEHVADEAEDGADLLAAGAAHFRQGVEDLENERMGVDDVDVPALDIDAVGARCRKARSRLGGLRRVAASPCSFGRRRPIRTAEPRSSKPGSVRCFERGGIR